MGLSRRRRERKCRRRGLAARAAPQLRDAPARRRRRPAQHPGATRARECVQHPDLHSGRVSETEKRLCAQPPSGLRQGETTLETNVKPIELRELWRRYKSDSDSKARERLVVAYSPLVKYVAGRTAAGLPPHVEEADLISYGLVGLISAIERFDLSRDIKFETYAIMRIKGAIIDELRSMDWVPRSVRARAREVERANAKLENTLQRAPTDQEIADEIGITVDELNESLLAISHSSMVALDELWSVSDSSGDQVSLMDTIEDPNAPDPSRALDVGDLKDRIADSIAKLPEREKLVIALYYYENLTLREIGEVLGVTESRVSQMHTKAVLRLRSRMQEESFDD
jgi:RNA polymerase sigma factor FliA